MKPATFTDEEVVALLSGAKTQMRRLVSPQPVVRRHSNNNGWDVCGEYCTEAESLSDFILRDYRFPCYYGGVGDSIWVREAFAERDDGTVVYRSDSHDDWNPIEWIQSNYMPERASRLHLKITGLRVELLQCIESPDIVREGLVCSENKWCDGSLCDGSCPSFRELFFAAWDRDRTNNGDTVASDNPWVNVIDFRLTKV